MATAKDKLTLKGFLARLEAGSYDSGTAARRGVGKCSWPESEKETARKAIAKKFGDDAKPAKPAKSAKAPKAPKAPKAAKPANAAKPAKAAAAVKSAPAKKAKKEDKPEAAKSTALATMTTPKPVKARRVRGELLKAVGPSSSRAAAAADIHYATQMVQDAQILINAVKAVQAQVEEKIDTHAPIALVNEALHITAQVVRSMRSEREGHEAREELRALPVHAPTNGVAAAPVKAWAPTVIEDDLESAHGT